MFILVRLVTRCEGMRDGASGCIVYPYIFVCGGFKEFSSWVIFRFHVNFQGCIIPIGQLPIHFYFQVLFQLPIYCSTQFATTYFTSRRFSPIDS